jgi:P27 family predicted phage terminase small subunit
MGKRGPAPEPSILKYIRGNPSKDLLPSDEPTPALMPQDFPPPKTLDGKSIEVWKEAVQTLARMRVLTEADVPTLTRYCIETVLYLACYEKVKVAGEEYTHWEPDPNRADGKLRIKYTQVAPWATQMHRHHAAMLRIEQEFGMTPSSRSQVSTTNGNADTDPVAAYAAKRRRPSGA